MKTIITLILSIFLLNVAMGQQSEPEELDVKNNKIWLGFNFTPRAFSTFDGGKPFEVTSILYAVPTYITGKWAFSPFYNFNFNRAGIFANYNVNKNLGVYVLADQELDGNFGAYGAGVTTPLYEDWVLGFIEMGGTRGDNPQPALLVGLYINFGKTIKEW